ncbi:MAG TPA: hypothetical protein VHP33_05400 [Polyangiaceae bacterium]|nr:hypothetical protein [Polyangiaceae bacterium]
MWHKTLGLVGSALLALSCGAASAPAAKPPEPVAPPAPVAPATHTASAELARYWQFGEKTQLALYADMGSLMHTDLFAGLVPGILENSEELLKSTQKDCLLVLSKQTREMLVGVDPHGAVLSLLLGPEGVKATRSACVGSLFPVERVTVQGADEAYGLSNREVVVVQSGVVLVGDKRLIEKALAAKTPAALPAALTIKDDQRLAFRVRLNEFSGGGVMHVSPERFRFALEVDVNDEAMASMVDYKVKQLREEAQKFAAQRTDLPLTKLLGAVDVQRQGKHFSGAFELRESVESQAHDLGTLIGLSVFGVRRYVQDAKTAEARVTIGEIARAYSAALKEPPPPGKKAAPKKLVSLPAVPATVPRGVKYQSSAADWQAWAPIHFAFPEPQYFQYEVVAAKDGKSAEILARGDLDGNGKSSLFRIKIELDPKTGQLTASDPSETDPLE